MEPRRPDDPPDAPVYVRPAPVRRHWLLRLVVTLGAASVAYDALTWITGHEGPVVALALVVATLTWVVCGLALVWVWKRHPF